jgi:hypothetical protein
MTEEEKADLKGLANTMLYSISLAGMAMQNAGLETDEAIDEVIDQVLDYNKYISEKFLTDSPYSVDEMNDLALDDFIKGRNFLIGILTNQKRQLAIHTRKEETEKYD